MNINLEIKEINEKIGSIGTSIAVLAESSKTMALQMKEINGRVGNSEQKVESLKVETRINHAARAENCPYKDKINSHEKQLSGITATTVYTKEMLALLISIALLLVTIAGYLFIISN